MEQVVARDPGTEVHNLAFSPAAASSGSPCSAATFEVNSEPHTGARPSVRLCVGLKIWTQIVHLLSHHK